MKLFWRMLWVLLVVAIIAGGIGLLFVKTSQPANVRIGNAALHARVAISEAEREQGLSGTSPLGDNDAMLFVFPSDAKWGIWMKDMNYPLDIVWLDNQKIVRHIVQDARPDSYPTVFTPTQPLRYVVEMKAGTAKQKSITIGTRAEITLP